MKPLTDEIIKLIAEGQYATYGEELNVHVSNEDRPYGSFVCQTGEALEHIAQRYLALTAVLDRRLEEENRNTHGEK